MRRRDFLRRQWDSLGLSAVGLQPINLKGKIEDVFSFVPLYRADVGIRGVFTMIDLYGMTRVTHDPFDEIDAKVERVKTWLLGGIGSEFSKFFYPHLNVQEIEALFLAEGNCLSSRLKDPNVRPEPNAEMQNFGNPPSRKIDRLFKSRRGASYDKINDSIALFKCLQFDPVYSTCAYFRQFYDDLVAVGRASL